jgi:glucokinase
VFDIGGTFIRAGLYAEGEGLKNEILKIQAPSFLEDKLTLKELQEIFLDKCTELAENVILKYPEYVIRDIGIAFPGPVGKNGIVTEAPTLWGTMGEDFPIADRLAERFSNYTVSIINDVTAAGWRYIDRFAGTFCIITISSGVGCKVFWNREVLLNEKGFGGELGHHYYGLDFKDIDCDCGKKGHVGAVSSGRGVEKLCRYMRDKYPSMYANSVLSGKDEISTYDIVRAVNGHDEFAVFVLEESINPIASAISQLYSFIGVDRYIIIGGFAAAMGSHYTNALTAELKRRGLFGLNDAEIEEMVVSGENDDNNGLVGMGRYIFERSPREVRNG